PSDGIGNGDALPGNTINRQHQSLVDGRHGKRWCVGPTPLVAP
ncbi:hypothetical protein A2U01_0081248, partial [Trifolium medium]|nr:hypothetical protein [Trifolium medium]